VNPWGKEVKDVEESGDDRCRHPGGPETDDEGQEAAGKETCSTENEGPVQAAVIGKRSGLIAIAPTSRTELRLITANAPTTPAVAIKTKYRPGA
jgi:hypothetical protein